MSDKADKKTTTTISRRDVLLTSLAVSVGASQSASAATPVTISQRWSISFSNDRPNIKTADTNGDGFTEVAVGDISENNGTDPYGIIDKDGNWVWQSQSGGRTVPTAVGDVNGDGNSEVIFRDNGNEDWYRPYTHTGDYLWSKKLPDLPDRGAALDFDGDGKAEILGVSHYDGYLNVWDNDGSSLWNHQSTEYVSRVLGFQQVTGSDMPELLTHIGETAGAPRTGLQLVSKDGGGIKQLWSYGPNERTISSFATLPNTPTPAILVSYPNTKEVHAVDNEGNLLWKTSVKLSQSSFSAKYFDLNGDGYTDAIIWAGDQIRIINGQSQSKTSIGFEQSIHEVAKYQNDQLAVLGTDQVAIVNRDGTTTASTSVDIGTPRGIAIAQFTSNKPSILCHGTDSLVAFDIKKSTNTAPSASFTVEPTSVNAGESVTLDASGTTDSDGAITQYQWDLNDDDSFEETGETVSHTFDTSGEYTITLAVTDDDGATDTVKKSISVSPDPFESYKKSHIETAEFVDENTVTDMQAVSRAETANEEFTEAVESGRISRQQATDAIQRLDFALDLTAQTTSEIGPANPSELTPQNLSKRMAIPALKTTLNLLTAGIGTANRAATGGGAGAKKLASQAKSKVIDAVNRILKSLFSKALNASKLVTAKSNDLVSQLKANTISSAAALDDILDEAVNTIAETVGASLRSYSEQGIGGGEFPVSFANLAEQFFPKATDVVFSGGASLESGLEIIDYFITPDNIANEGLSGEQDEARLAWGSAEDGIESSVEKALSTIEDAEEAANEIDIGSAIIDLWQEPDLAKAVKAVGIVLINIVAGGIVSAFQAGAGTAGLMLVNFEHQVGILKILAGTDEAVGL